MYPRIDVSYPEEIQFNCISYDNIEAQESGCNRKNNEVRCIPNSNVKLVADLFSIWNNSIISTKPQILKKITATVKLNQNRAFPFIWKYFTEIVDNANSQKGNTGRVILNYGDLRNIEVEFIHGQITNEKPMTMTWKKLTDSIVASDKVIVDFSLDIAYGSEKKVRCTLDFRKKDIGKLKSNNYSGHYIVANSVCQELN